MLLSETLILLYAGGAAQKQLQTLERLIEKHGGKWIVLNPSISLNGSMHPHPSTDDYCITSNTSSSTKSAAEMILKRPDHLGNFIVLAKNVRQATACQKSTFWTDDMPVGEILDFAWLSKSIAEAQLVPKDHYVLLKPKADSASAMDQSKPKSVPKVDSHVRPNVDKNKLDQTIMRTSEPIQSATKRVKLDHNYMVTQVSTKSPTPRIASTLAAACQLKTPAIPRCATNQAIIEQFSILQRHRHINGQRHSAESYANAISILKRLENEIRSGKQAMAIDGIGVKIAKQIEEFVSTGKMTQVEHILESGPTYKALDALYDILGVGVKTAEIWYHRYKFTCITDIRQHMEGKLNKPDLELNALQRIGVKYYEDLRKRLSRKDAEGILDVLYAVIQSFPEPYRSNIQMIPAGSFRRKGGTEAPEESTFGDLDILFCYDPESDANDSGKPDAVSTCRYFAYKPKRIVPLPQTYFNDVPPNCFEGHFLPHFITVLRRMGYIQETVRQSMTEDDDNANAKDNPPLYQVWMGIFAQPVPSTCSTIARRVDFIQVHRDEFSFALLGWTGSKDFERSIRWCAKQQHQLKLTHRGIYPYDSSGKGCSATCCEISPKAARLWTEEDIFSFLGLAFMPAIYRNA